MIKLTLIFILFAACCFSQTVTKSTPAGINVTDSAGKKQGKWMVTGKMQPLRIDYFPGQLVETGYYRDNCKTGIWKEFYPNGSLKNEITFENGRPEGKLIFYHDNGCKAEEGTWKNNRWIGIYTAYDKTEKQVNQLDFKSGGKREGKRTTYCNTL